METLNPSGAPREACFGVPYSWYGRSPAPVGRGQRVRGAAHILRAVPSDLTSRAPRLSYGPALSPSRRSDPLRRRVPHSLCPSPPAPRSPRRCPAREGSAAALPLDTFGRDGRQSPAPAAAGDSEGPGAAAGSGPGSAHLPDQGPPRPLAQW